MIVNLAKLFSNAEELDDLKVSYTKADTSALEDMFKDLDVDNRNW